MTIELITQTNEGKVTKTHEVQEMNIKQVAKVAKGVSRIVNFINKNDKLQNAIKTFTETRAEVIKEAQAYYEEYKDEKEVPEYDVGGVTLQRAAGYVWNDILGVLSDLLYEIPETVIEVVAEASNINPKILEAQDIETFIDVIDETIQVNDIEKLIGRVKKLGNSLKPMFKLNNNKEEQ